MKRNSYPKTRATALASALALLTTLLFAQIDDEEEELFELSPFTVDASGGFGATPGGAQDIAFARSQINLGNIPHPNTFRAEGLFSEHDLPLVSPNICDEMVCVFGQAMPARLLELPEATHLAQIGFASGLDPKTWQRPPLNLIAVVDKSGSMGGQPLQLVRDSLLEVLAQLDDKDQLSIVLYGDRSYVHLQPTRANQANRSLLEQSIRSISSAGSTNMEDGLRIGYQLARRSASDFAGTTRLMLFTDERPNTGNTSKEGFMGQMRAGSERGFGLTTIGVGVQFGAELANAISSVRGGNLFYFPDEAIMTERFATEFDPMVTELAYDLELSIIPEAGYRIAGVYGVPGDMLQWQEDDRSIAMKVETLFLSLRKGAIYFALAPERHQDLPSHPTQAPRIASVSVAYENPVVASRTRQSFEFISVDRQDASLGLQRGELLINEYISLKKATAAHHLDNDQESAYQIMSTLANLLRSAGDPALDAERELVEQLEARLALLSGHSSEYSATGDAESSLAGLWIAHPNDNASLHDTLLIQFKSGALLQQSWIDDDGSIYPESFAVATAPFPSSRRGQLSFHSYDQFHTLKPTLHDDAAKLAETLDYYGDLAAMSFRIKGDKLFLTSRDSSGQNASKLLLHRYRGIAPTARAIEPVEVEFITGLPKRR